MWVRYYGYCEVKKEDVSRGEIEDEKLIREHFGQKNIVDENDDVDTNGVRKKRSLESELLPEEKRCYVEESSDELVDSGVLALGSWLDRNLEDSTC